MLLICMLKVNNIVIENITSYITSEINSLLIIELSYY